MALLDSYGIGALSDAIGPQAPLYRASFDKFLEPWKIPWTSTDSYGPAIYVVAPGGEVMHRKACRDVHCSLRAELEPALTAPTVSR